MAKKKAGGDAAPGGKGKTLAMAAFAAIGLLGALKGFVLPGGDTAAAAGVPTTTTTKPGPIVTLDPITVNLQGDRFLKVGLGLQLSGKAAGGGGGHGAKDTDDPTKGFARALDLTIETFGGHSYDHLVKPEGRAQAKQELLHRLEEAYHGEVENIYFTDFVMQ